MSTEILKLNKKKSSPKNFRTQFNTHLNKITKLKKELESLRQDYEKALILFNSKIHPHKITAVNGIIEFLKKVIDVKQNTKAFTKKEHQIIDDVILDSFQTAFQLVGRNTPNEELLTLYTQFYKVNFEDDDNEDDKENMFEQSSDSHNFNDDEFTHFTSSHKTKKEILEENKARELKLIHNKELGRIYKSLAKELHPDLEQNSEKKQAKEQIMKKLTVAYENHDLITLLELESECLNSSQSISVKVDEGSLKVYNNVLKNQIKDLQKSFEQMCFDPRYHEISQHTCRAPREPLACIEHAKQSIQSIVDEYAFRLKDFSNPNPVKIIKQRLKSRLEAMQEEQEVQNFENFLNSLFEEANKNPGRKKKNK